MAAPVRMIAVALVAALSITVATLAPSASAKHAKRPWVSSPNVKVSEHAGMATVRVSVAKRAKKKLKIHFHTVADTAHSAADFVGKSGVVAIRKHHKTAKIQVQIVANTTHEATERFVVALSGSSVRFKNPHVHVTITDDDPAPPPPPPPPAAKKLHGTLTFHVNASEYYADLELGSPGNLSELSTLTMKVSLVRAPNGSWIDDGTSSWSYTSKPDLWFRRGEGVDIQDNGFPYGCADDAGNNRYYRRTEWSGSAGHNAGKLIVPPSQYAQPQLHQGFITLSGYDPGGTGSPVLKVVAHLRPDLYSARIADGAHICDPATSEHPNPIEHQGADDAYLDSFEVPAFQAWIPRSPDTGGLTATYNGSSLAFADSDTQSSHTGFFNDDTGHYTNEETEKYTVTGTLTLG